MRTAQNPPFFFKGYIASTPGHRSLGTHRSNGVVRITQKAHLPRRSRRADAGASGMGNRFMSATSCRVGDQKNQPGFLIIFTRTTCRRHQERNGACQHPKGDIVSTSDNSSNLKCLYVTTQQENEARTQTLTMCSVLACSLVSFAAGNQSTALFSPPKWLKILAQIDPRNHLERGLRATDLHTDFGRKFCRL